MCKKKNKRSSDIYHIYNMAIFSPMVKKKKKRKEEEKKKKSLFVLTVPAVKTRRIGFLSTKKNTTDTERQTASAVRGSIRINHDR